MSEIETDTSEMLVIISSGLCMERMCIYCRDCNVVVLVSSQILCFSFSHMNEWQLSSYTRKSQEAQEEIWVYWEGG